MRGRAGDKFSKGTGRGVQILEGLMGHFRDFGSSFFLVLSRIRTQFVSGCVWRTD